MSVVSGLPARLPATVFVVLHMPPTSHSYLPEILSRSGPLTATQARDNEEFHPGHIYVAPPDHHLLVMQGHMLVRRGPYENRHRPAVDPLFRSAAVAYTTRVVGVVLSGAMDDGTSGLLAIKQLGGIAICQDPAEALIADMPAHAREFVDIDHVTGANQIGQLLSRLAHESVATGDVAVPQELENEVRVASGNPQSIGTPPTGSLTVYACPDCGGPLWELHEKELLRFRCRNGHALTADSVLEGSGRTVQEALWVALNTLENSILVAQRLARDARARGLPLTADRMETKVVDSHRSATIIRQVLLARGAEVAPRAGPTPTSRDSAPKGSDEVPEQTDAGN